MNNKVIIGVIIVILVVSGIIYGVKNSNTDSNVDITIGAVLSQTGYGAVDGVHIKKGMDLAVMDLKKEGINVKIVYEDDATDPKQTVSAIQKVINQDKVDVVVGPIWSFLVDAAVPVIDSNKIVTLSPSSSSEVVEGGSDYMFYGSYKNIESANVLAKWIRDNHITKVASVVSNDSWGQSVYAAFKKAASDTGAEIVVDEKISFGTDSSVMPTIVSKIAHSGAEVILWTGYDEAGTLLVNKVIEQNLNIPVIAEASVMKGLVQRGNIKKGTDVYVVDVSITDSFKDKYRLVYNEEAETFTDGGYDTVMLLVDAIQNKPENVSLSAYMRDTVDYKGYAGTYNFDQNGDISGGAWVIKKIQ